LFGKKLREGADHVPEVSSGHSGFLLRKIKKNIDIKLDKWEFRGRIKIERCKKAGRKKM
jgi:hypothetical protein